MNSKNLPTTYVDQAGLNFICLKNLTFEIVYLKGQILHRINLEYYSEVPTISLPILFKILW